METKFKWKRPNNQKTKSLKTKWNTNKIIKNKMANDSANGQKIIMKMENKQNRKNRTQKRQTRTQNHYEEFQMTIRTMKIAIRAMNSKIEYKKDRKIEHKKNQKNRTTKIKE